MVPYTNVPTTERLLACKCSGPQVTLSRGVLCWRDYSWRDAEWGNSDGAGRWCSAALQACVR